MLATSSTPTVRLRWGCEQSPSVRRFVVCGDGRVDILSASYNDNKIAWYKNGGGSPTSWTPYTITTTAGFATSVFAAAA
jgi:hypothetical protein